MTDPYAPCPCGSGKKFKWCCQPIYAHINRAFDQDAQGQHEAALRIMDEVTAEHGGNPEAWGQKAKLLYGHGKVEQAEEALEKAFAINRNYPYGLLLKAAFRFQEGELPGALLLARRAAEAYDPEARDYLAEAYSLIYECEMKLNRPVAARAALKIVLHLQPAAEEVRDAFDQTFGEKSRLPAAARHEYTLMRPTGTNPAARRSAWDRALSAGQSPRLSELARAFDELTKEDAGDAAAWFNLGLARAWLGENAAGPRRAQPVHRAGVRRGQGDDRGDPGRSGALRPGHGRILRLPRIRLRLPVPRPAGGGRPGAGVAAGRPADDAAAAAGGRAVRHAPGAEQRRRHHGGPAGGRRGPAGGLPADRRAALPHVGAGQGGGRPGAGGGPLAPQPGYRRGPRSPRPDPVPRRRHRGAGLPDEPARRHPPRPRSSSTPSATTRKPGFTGRAARWPARRRWTRPATPTCGRSCAAS